MARQYSVEVHRNDIQALLFMHDDDTVELTDPDSGVNIKYLTAKMDLVVKIIEWMKAHGVLRLECNYIPPEE